MDDLKQFERWAARAREEQSPNPEIAPAVLARLRQGGAESPAGPGAWTWIWAASAATACAAVLAAVIGYAAWIEIASPWTTWFSELSNWGML